jgi:hypothetical protein
VGFLLRAACLQRPQVIWGLPTHVAAGMAMVLQWSVGSMFPVYIMVTVLIRERTYQPPISITTFLELWQRVYGSVINHWGMLLTLYCLHNVSLGLPEGCLDEEKEPEEDDDDEPTRFSMEWNGSCAKLDLDLKMIPPPVHSMTAKQKRRMSIQSCSKTTTTKKPVRKILLNVVGKRRGRD